MDDICDLLDTYNGRDKIVRLACYSLKLWGSIKKDEGLLRASSKLSATRATMRLFDDLPMLRHTLEYGLGRSEPDKTFSILGVLGNVVDQLFFPIEKICWFGECGVIKLSDKQMFAFDTINTVFWATSLYITLLRCLKQFQITSQQKECITKAMHESELRKQINSKYWLESITILKLCIDITHAVNCLPNGWLWGGKLDGVKVGAIATLSSLIGIAMHFARKKYFKS
ncbi:peroxisomal membrane protein 11C-like [Arctopsyche grandis]|uniref:peroxisomal membrane protein 11C-like n=1 Tax=Arctopsyche grandis TaxID=121162 RepID=UPI00406D7349